MRDNAERIADSYANLLIRGALYTAKPIDFSMEYAPYMGISIAVERPNHKQRQLIPVRLYGALYQQYVHTLEHYAYSGVTVEAEGFPYSEKVPVVKGATPLKLWNFEWYLIASRFSVVEETTSIGHGE